MLSNNRTMSRIASPILLLLRSSAICTYKPLLTALGIRQGNELVKIRMAQRYYNSSDQSGGNGVRKNNTIHCLSFKIVAKV